MHFAEAELKYHELEEKLVRGELSESEFLKQVAEFRVVDEAGHRWMLSGRSGRWLVHDGQQWVFEFSHLPQGITRITITFNGTKTDGIGLAFNNFDATGATVVPISSGWSLAFLVVLLTTGMAAVLVLLRRSAAARACQRD